MRLGYDAKRAFHNKSGLGNYSRDIIRIMMEYFPSNEFVLYNPKPGKINWLAQNTLARIQYPESFIWKKLPGLWRQTAISKQIEKDGIDIYHGLSGEIPRDLNKKGTKVAVTIHDLLFVRFPELYKPIDRKIYRNKFAFASQNADVVIAISEQTKRDIIEFLGCDEKKIKVHYQGCHPIFKRVFSMTDRHALLKELNLPEKFILNVGTLEKRKNALSILQAIKDSDHHLVLVGKSTNYVDELKSFIAVNKMEGKVHFLHGLSIEKLAVLYQAATVFCYPSIFEGFGIPIIESLFSRTAVITSSGSCFAEAGGPDSVYVAPNNIPSLKNQINDLMENETRRQQMEEAGFMFVQKFRDEIIAEKLMDIYTELYEEL